MSVRIGSFRSDLILPRIRRPSFSPGPRNPFSEDRLALSKEALKMYGNPASAATLAIFSAMARACDSVSMTQGPAIRKRGLPAPRRSLPSSISRVAFIGDGKKPVNYLGYAGRAGFATVRQWREAQHATPGRVDVPRRWRGPDANVPFCAPARPR